MHATRLVLTLAMSPIHPSWLRLTVTLRELRQVVQSMKPDSAPGPDGIRAKHIQEFIKNEIFEEALLKAVDHSIREHKFELKHARIKPVLKPSGGYRPISQLSVIGKI